MFKRFCFILPLLLLLFSANLNGNETAKLYFPSTLGSFWIYEDHDGNEITREIVDGEEISGVTYDGFSNDPEIEDWNDFDRHTIPYLFHIGDEWVSFLVGEEVENAVKARLNNEMATLNELTKNVLTANAPPELNVNIELIYDVEVKSEDNFFLLPLDVTPDEEWDAININATITFTVDIQGLPDFQGAPEIPAITLDINILETGKVLGYETVDVAAGTFEDCLKLEFRTETELTASEPSDEEGEPGESVTTIWFAPNVGLVKFHQESEKVILNTMSDSDFSEASLNQHEIDALIAPTVRTFELESYEVANDPAQESESE